MTSLELSDRRGRRRVWASDLNKISGGLGILNLAPAVMNEPPEVEGWVAAAAAAWPEERTWPGLACSRWLFV